MAPSDNVKTDVQFEPGRGGIAHFEITVVRGPDAGAVLRLDETRPGRALVGQGPSCDLKLSDWLVSRRHVALEVRGGDLRVTDLGSTNGTAVSGIRVVEGFLKGGERIALGATTLEVVRLVGTPDAAVPLSRGFGRLVGASLEMRRLYPMFERAAASDAPLVIEGETGTGKEILAETLHERGPRAQGRFVVFDCATASEDRAAALLFGDVREGSHAQGVFEQADGGTLLLDEVGELPLEVQPLLSRALERSEFLPLGADKPRRVSIRFIASTRQDLDRQVQERRLREELFYRLAVTRIELPPLRERHGDVGVLARHFWSQLGGSQSALPYTVFEDFERYSWPGNVRELQGAVLRTLTMGEGPPLASARSAAGSLRSFCDPALPYPRAKEELLRAFEREYVEALVEAHGGNVHRAAYASGLALRYFQVLRARHRDG